MQSALHTIGYEGSSIDDFLATLALAGIETIIDVRDVPLSRKRGFSKKSLSENLARSGMRYCHLKGLGDPKDGRVAAREGRFSDFRRIYGEHLRSDVAQSDLQTAISVASIENSCLLCFERDYHECHRLVVANEMAKRSGFRVIHLGVRQGAATRAIERRPHGDFAFVG